MGAIATRKLQFLLPRWSPGDLERSLYEGQHHDQDPSDILNIQDWREKGPNDMLLVRRYITNRHIWYDVCIDYMFSKCIGLCFHFFVLSSLLVSFSQHFFFAINDRVGDYRGQSTAATKMLSFMTLSGISCGAGTLPWRWDGWKRPRVRVLFLLHMALPFVSSSEEGNIWEFGSSLFHLLSSSVCRWTCVRGPCNNVLQRRLLFDCWEDEFLG